MFHKSTVCNSLPAVNSEVYGGRASRWPFEPLTSLATCFKRSSPRVLLWTSEAIVPISSSPRHHSEGECLQTNPLNPWRNLSNVAQHLCSVSLGTCTPSRGIMPAAHAALGLHQDTPGTLHTYRVYVFAVCVSTHVGIILSVVLSNT